MFCYYCGAELDSTDTCPNCEADVRLMKKIQAASNICYNKGLEKAKVRDLSGAVEVLKKSLKYNKLNMDARNLLGLIYFEMGESVDAISEWVISKSLIPDNNPASYYLDEVQNNATYMDLAKQTSRKFNQALQYCRDGDDDLAVIQLKKVLSQNPKLVKGHQLLALVYMKQGSYDLARKELRSAENIDADNTLTMQYLKECNEHLHGGRKREKSGKQESSDDEDIISYKRENELIIRPRRFRDNTVLFSAVNLLIGAAIGVAVVWFLIVPSIRQSAQQDANSAVVEANETISTREQDIESLEEEIESLNSQIEEAQAASDAETGKIDSYENLLQAYIAYAGEDYESAQTYLESVSEADLSEQSLKVYNTVLDTVKEEVLGDLYREGVSEYESGNYDEAASILKEIVEMDEAYEEGNALYYLAWCYYQQDDGTNATTWFQKLVDCEGASSSLQESAQSYIDYIESHADEFTSSSDEESEEE